MDTAEVASNRPIRLTDGEEFTALVEERPVVLVEFYTTAVAFASGWSRCSASSRKPRTPRSR